MKVLSDPQALGQDEGGGVWAIGNFDGVHRGHQVLLEKARERAESQGRILGVLSFNPHPGRFFQPEAPPFLLTSPDVKAWRLSCAGVAVWVDMPFTPDFSALSAQEFLNSVIGTNLNAAHVVIGEDFRFGHGRQGDANFLKAWAAEHGIGVTALSPVRDHDGTTFSSSAIRHALRDGDMHTAYELLGWEWEISGTVMKGDQRGRELGYPTANMEFGEIIVPAHGVYASRVSVSKPGDAAAEWRPAISNIGIRPMFLAAHPLLETYIFDFEGDIYGQNLRVKPVRFLRGEAAFDSVEELKIQMDRDCEDARAVLDQPA